MSLELEVEERERYAKEGFFVRESVFGPEDLVSFRAAAERVAKAAEHAALEKAMAIAAANAADGDDYRIDGNRYVEAANATVQFEHASDSKAIRVIEPFVHLDPVFDACRKFLGLNEVDAHGLFRTIEDGLPEVFD